MASNFNAKFTFAVLALAMLAGVTTQLLTRDKAQPATSATRVTAAKPLPDFTLTFGDGTAFTTEDLRDQWTLLFFGFTSCPDICPTTLATLARVRERLEKQQARMPRVIFVSVDPRGDTAELADKYAKGFDPSFAGASGDIDALRKLTDPLGILFLEVDVAGGYTVDHTTALTLIGPDAALAAVLGGPHRSQELANDLQHLVP